MGTEDRIHPHSARRLHEAIDRGVRVVVATGRSEGALRSVVSELRLTTPVICYNGAAIYEPGDGSLEVRHPLDAAVVERALAFADRTGTYSVSMIPGRKFALRPEDDAVRGVLESFHDLQFVSREELAPPGVIRLSLFSAAPPSSADFAAAVEPELPDDAYITHFPLRLLPRFRESPFYMVDIHAPCHGKGEAFTVLEERYGISAERVVAIGDAENDRPMLERAGLAVVMENAVPSVHDCADRVIGHCDSGTVGDLVHELFLA